MTQHRLDASPETVHWGYFDAARKPLLTIENGDVVTISTVSGVPAQMPPQDLPFKLPKALADIHATQTQQLPGHICTGPVAVRGAKPGMTLEVQIQSIGLNYDWGYNMIRPMTGALPEDFAEPRVIHIPLDRQRMVGRLPWGLDIPLRPFFGVMAVAPPAGWGSISTLPPRRTAATWTTRNWWQGRRSIFQSISTARCSRSATAMARRATAKSMSTPSRQA